MHSFFLYDEPPLAVVERERPREPSAICRGCPLGKAAATVCMQPDGDPDGLLVVADYPGDEEDKVGRPFVGRSGAYLRSFLGRHWDGPIMYANAVNCAPSGREVTGEYVAACRGYLAHAVRKARPQRILALGRRGIQGLLGRSVPVSSVRRGYAKLLNTNITEAGDSIPVFFTYNPAAAMRNRLVRMLFEGDVRWSLKADPPDPAWDGVGYLIETVEDSEQACAKLRAAPWFSFDCETAGVMYEPDFRLLCLGACPVGSDDAYVWPREALLDEEISAPLKTLLSDPSVPKVGQHLKYDAHSSRCGLSCVVHNHWGDTRLWRKLQDASVIASDLEVLSELVGMGGMKEVINEHMARAVKTIQKERAMAKKSLPLPGLDPVLELAVKYPEEEPKRFAFGLVPKNVLYRYNARDAVTTTRLGCRLGSALEANPELHTIWTDIMVDASEGMEQVEAWGIAASRENAQLFDSYVRGKLDEIEARFAKYPNFNPASPPSVGNFLFKELKLTPTKETDTGAPSTDKESLKLLSGQHPVVDDLLEWRRLSKLHGTYAVGVPSYIRSDGRIHPSIKLDGAETGRTSCIAGWCKVRTRRGEVPISEVCVGDEVWTHRERWRRVTSFMRRGVRPVVSLHLGDGNVLTCTTDHRLLGQDGTWVTAGVLAYGCEQGMDEQSIEQRGGGGPLPQLGMFDVREDRGEVGDTLGECTRGDCAVHTGSRAEGTSLVEVFCEQNRGEESDAREALRRAPQLEGGVRRRAWLPDNQVQREEALLASCGDDESVGRSSSPEVGGGSPYRREPEKQQSGKLGTSNQAWAPAHSLFAGEGQPCSRVTEAVDGGSVEVYDISVDEDASFMVAGIFAHNCEEPNLQNIARPSTVEAKMARDLFVAPPGRVLLEADFSQLELRVATMLSGDPEMLKIWQEGVDYHQRTAELIAQTAWGIDPSQVTSEHRSQAKTVNFAILYGMAAKTLSRRLNITEREAERILIGVRGRFRAFARWCDEQLHMARTRGHVRTWWAGKPARRRPLLAIANKGSSQTDRKAVANAEHAAVNTPIQGTASDYCLASLGSCVKWLRDDFVPAKLVLTVHDSLMFEVDDDARAIEEVAFNANRIMSSWPSAGKVEVPLVVDFKVGKAWGSLKEYALAA